ncbi:hypothetical protein SRHO_G00076850 [Serrasalmus rhombeus]
MKHETYRGATCEGACNNDISCIISLIHDHVKLSVPHKDPESSAEQKQLLPEQKIFMTDYPNSIDDEFEGCKDKMFDLVTKKLLDVELNSNGNFRAAWNEAESGLDLGNAWDSSLTRDNLRRIALRAYTENTIYRELNDKMREGRGTYKTEFGLISLHFLMTDGLQTRNAQHKCSTTYRRTSAAITITKKFVRFGSFASSSLKTTQEKFGTETCFIIYTCFGADISDVSAYPNEAEVLIPPYELFVTEPVTFKPPYFSKCRLVYRLRSEAIYLNCPKPKVEDDYPPDGFKTTSPPPPLHKEWQEATGDEEEIDHRLPMIQVLLGGQDSGIGPMY